MNCFGITSLHKHREPSGKRDGGSREGPGAHLRGTDRERARIHRQIPRESAI